MIGKRVSGVATIGALVAIAGFATAAIMFTTGEQALERLGILVAVFASIVPGLIASLRADQAATSSSAVEERTNGQLDERISAAVQHALKVRRHSDEAVVGPASSVSVPLTEGDDAGSSSSGESQQLRATDTLSTADRPG